MFPTSTVTPAPVSRMLPRYWATLGGALLAAAAVLIVAASVLSGSPASNAHEPAADTIDLEQQQHAPQPAA